MLSIAAAYTDYKKTITYPQKKIRAALSVGRSKIITLSTVGFVYSQYTMHFIYRRK